MNRGVAPRLGQDVLFSQHLTTQQLALPSRPTPLIARPATQPSQSSTPPVHLKLELVELLERRGGREVGPSGARFRRRDRSEDAVEGVDVPEEGDGADGDGERVGDELVDRDQDKAEGRVSEANGKERAEGCEAGGRLTSWKVIVENRWMTEPMMPRPEM
jgi:hypothetical protein